jgi:hypothetical protein
VPGDFNDSATIARALTGINPAFLLTPSSEQAEVQQSAFVDIVRRAGVRHTPRRQLIGLCGDRVLGKQTGDHQGGGDHQQDADAGSAEKCVNLAHQGQYQCGATARSILWMYTSRDVYRMLVHESGWTPDRYQQWLSDTLVNALVSARARSPSLRMPRPAVGAPVHGRDDQDTPDERAGEYPLSPRAPRGRGSPGRVHGSRRHANLPY